jgi:asparagine synthetase B (glutamine-hydrolysing)
VLSGEGADEIFGGICILEMHLLQKSSKNNRKSTKLFTADLLR